MDKLIIENRTKIPWYQVIDYVSIIIGAGKTSKTSKGKQYCFATRFEDGVVVYADKNKKSDKLIISIWKGENK